MEGDAGYFRRRASEERSHAVHTRHPRARQAHLEMAERYEDLVRAIVSRERHLGLGLDEVAEARAQNPSGSS